MLAGLKVLPLIVSLVAPTTSNGLQSADVDVYSFSQGIQTQDEVRYNVDLREDFTREELDDIFCVLDSIEERVYPLTELDLVIERYEPTDGFGATMLGEARTNMISEEDGKNYDFLQIRSKEFIDSYKDGRSFADVFAHEVGHLVVINYEDRNSRIRSKFRELNQNLASKDLVDGRIRGFVSDYGSFHAAKSEIDRISAEADEFEKTVAENMKGIERKRASLSSLSDTISRLPQEPSLDNYKAFFGESEKYREDLPQSIVDMIDMSKRYFEASSKPENEVHDNMKLFLEDMSLGIEMESFTLTLGLEFASLIPSLNRASTELGAASLAMTQIGYDETNEDIAETFAYWVQGHHHADDDLVVRKKVQILKKHLK